MSHNLSTIPICESVFAAPSVLFFCFLWVAELAEYQFYKRELLYHKLINYLW